MTTTTETTIAETTTATPTDDNREWLTELLPKNAHRHIDAILTTLVPDTVHAVDIVGARVRVEEIEAYGLTIGLDANGNAATVHFPYGAEVAG